MATMVINSVKDFIKQSVTEITTDVLDQSLQELIVAPDEENDIKGGRLYEDTAIKNKIQEIILENVGVLFEESGETIGPDDIHLKEPSPADNTRAPATTDNATTPATDNPNNNASAPATTDNATTPAPNNADNPNNPNNNAVPDNTNNPNNNAVPDNTNNPNNNAVPDNTNNNASGTTIQGGGNCEGQSCSGGFTSMVIKQVATIIKKEIGNDLISQIQGTTIQKFMLALQYLLSDPEIYKKIYETIHKSYDEKIKKIFERNETDIEKLKEDIKKLSSMNSNYEDELIKKRNEVAKIVNTENASETIPEKNKKREEEYTEAMKNTDKINEAMGQISQGMPNMSDMSKMNDPGVLSRLGLRQEAFSNINGKLSLMDTIKILTSGNEEQITKKFQEIASAYLGAGQMAQDGVSEFMNLSTSEKLKQLIDMNKKYNIFLEPSEQANNALESAINGMKTLSSMGNRISSMFSNPLNKLQNPPQTGGSKTKRQNRRTHRKYMVKTHKYHYAL